MVPHRPYELKEYDPLWKRRFLAAAEELKPIFGDNLVEIEHIGSTSIEGMIAKPQIDILVVVKKLDVVKDCYHTFIRSGYVPRGQGYTRKGDEYFTKDLSEGNRLVSVHTLQKGNPRIEEYKTFRDYMRVNKKDRELYASTKGDLYASYRDNYAAYYSGKTGLLDSIQIRAKEWAKRIAK